MRLIANFHPMVILEQWMIDGRLKPSMGIYAATQHGPNRSNGRTGETVPSLCGSPGIAYSSADSVSIVVPAPHRNAAT
jgi:hypothetical protein